MAEKTTFSTVDEYIAAFPADVQEKLQAIRRIIREEAPHSKEAIKYGMPTFTLKGNLVYFAAWKQHISLYPLTEAMEAAFDEIAKYNTSGKGTIQFPLNQPLPEAFIRKLVAFRVKEHTGKV